jgi:hypothetical protein
MSEETAGGGCFYSMPTRRERFWRWAGFRYHHDDDPEGCETLQGWMRTDMYLGFGWIDRLRILISGRLFIASVVHTDTPSPIVCKTRMDWHILAPGDPHWPKFRKDEAAQHGPSA